LDARRRRFLDEVAAYDVVAFDTSACIYYLARQEPWFSLLAPILARASAGPLRIVLSAIVQLELLVKPYRMRDQALVRRVHAFTAAHRGIVSAPISPDVVDAAAQVRAAFRLKIPDAIVAASAAVAGAGLVIGNDAEFVRLNDADHLRLVVGAREYRAPAFVQLSRFA
jgi:predicted nucleic acid-binding protein